MKEISIDTGVKTYSVNGCEIQFNPTDVFFAERLVSIFEKLDSKRAECEEEMRGADTKKVFELARKYDCEMREMLDGAVGGPVSAAVAGELNIYAMSGGLPIFAKIIMALWDEIGESISIETKAMNPRLNEVLRKYRK